MLGAKIATAPAHQVARLSALRAMRKRSGRPSSSSAGTRLCRSRSSRRTCCTWLSRRRPISVGAGGVTRTSTGWPTRASSSLIRWEIADCDKPSTWAARSNPACSITAAKAESNL